MKKELRSLSKIDADIRSAGKSFLGLHLGDLLARSEELEDPLLKSKLITYYYENQHGFFDRHEGGTNTRVNAAIRIIRAGQVEYVLNNIVNSGSRVAPEAVAKAQETLKRIRMYNEADNSMG